MAPKDKSGMRFFIAATTAVIAAIVVAAGYMAYLCVVSGTWPSVPGQITQSELGHSQRVSQNDTGVKVREIYQASIAYTYQVNGQEYSSTKFALFSPLRAATLFQAEALLSPYPVGAVVPVYYNPKRPEMAVLETGWRGTTRRILGTGLLAGLYVTALGSYALWGKEQDPKTIITDTKRRA